MITKESPLNGMKHGTVATISIREIPNLPAFDLRVSPGTASQVVEKAIAIALPLTPGLIGSTASGDAHALCLGPDWWLIIGSSEAENLLTPLRSQNLHFSVVDVSGQRTTIEIEGLHAREVLAHLWEQDLREKSFPVGRASQGLMVKAPVIVWHYEKLRYRVMVRSSFALHVWRALVDAAEEWL